VLRPRIQRPFSLLRNGCTRMCSIAQVLRASMYIKRLGNQLWIVVDRSCVFMETFSFEFRRHALFTPTFVATAMTKIGGILDIQFCARFPVYPPYATPCSYCTGSHGIVYKGKVCTCIFNTRATKASSGKVTAPPISYKNDPWQTAIH
jgi:hypothetical protein